MIQVLAYITIVTFAYFCLLQICIRSAYSNALERITRVQQGLSQDIANGDIIGNDACKTLQSVSWIVENFRVIDFYHVCFCYHYLMEPINKTTFGKHNARLQKYRKETRRTLFRKVFTCNMFSPVTYPIVLLFDFNFKNS